MVFLDSNVVTTNRNFILMNKNTPVLNFNFFDKPQGNIFVEKINEIYAADYLPLWLVKTPQISPEKLNEWWVRRIEPSFIRLHKIYDDVVKKHTMLSHYGLVKKYLGLSLYDQYWIKPELAATTWESVNYFDNDFSDHFYRYAIGDKTILNEEFSPNSPDNTTPGYIKKNWRIENGKRELASFGYGPFFQRPFNALIMSNVLSYLGVPHIDYNVIFANQSIFSVSECFIDGNVEYVPISDLVTTYNSGTFYSEIENKVGRELCRILKFTMNERYVLWYLFNFVGYDGDINVDNSVSNIGFVRDVRTLEYRGIVPFHDFSNCMYYKMKEDAGVLTYMKTIYNSLEKYYYESGLEINKIKDLPELVLDIFRQQEVVPSDHVDFIIGQLRQRINQLVAKVKMGIVINDA